MRLFVLAICFLLLSSGNLFAKTVYDINLPDTVTIDGENLQLNGYGLRKKFFFKIYLGSLYTREKATTTEQVLAMPGAKLIRMNFIHKKVEREKITQAFVAGFANNSPQLIDSPKLEEFINLFNEDFFAGDQVDLELAADGTVSVRQNSEILGKVTSTPLVKAVLLIYLGNSPADTNLKQGMLGGN
jgi:hypothetical protein